MGKAEVNSKAKLASPYELALGDELRGERATIGKSLLDVQRELRIRAAYIAAIEDAQVAVFPNPGFIPGYVRSYARYLNLDPEQIYRRFCDESGFAGPQDLSRRQDGRQDRGPMAKTGGGPQPRASGMFRPDFPGSGRGRGLPEIPVSAIGSVLVMIALVAGLGYGGWTVLQNIQRVQFAPVEDLPLALAEVDALQPPEANSMDEPLLTDLASPVAATALADLYRQQELEVSILVPRDGPIAAIDPDRAGPPAHLAAAGAPDGAQDTVTATVAQMVQAMTDTPDPLLPAAIEIPAVTVLAERAAWVRVYLADGTVIFERILERGETYAPPQDATQPMIWAGNAGSVYVRVGQDLRGPLGSGTKAIRDVVLDPQALVERFAVVETVPEGIAQTIGALSQQTAASIAVE